MLISALLAVASAQVLRISPAVIGQGSPATQQVILLAQGGSLGAGALRASPLQTVAVQPAAQPVRTVLVAQPAPAPVVSAQPVGRFVASARLEEENLKPSPYGYSFESEDEFGTKLGRQEQADDSGVVTGSYTLSDATGISRVVTYVADENGFRATVKTNEPGTLTSNPADVEIESTAQ